MNNADTNTQAVETLMAKPIKWDADGTPLVYAYDRADAEMIVDTLTEAGFWLVKPDPDEPHTIEFRDDGWTIKHTLAERLDGDAVFDCQLANWRGGDPGLRGRFELLGDRTVGREFE